MHELVLGGQRSGKSRCAERRAAEWLQGPGREARLIATAEAGDAEMAARIARHRADRAARLPALGCEELARAPLALSSALRRHAAPHRLVVVDCLTLWLTGLRMPRQGDGLDDAGCAAEIAALTDALRVAPGPVLLVSNEIGLGVTPMSAEARRFVDDLGRLHQTLAALCPRVTLMVAGVELAVKREGV